MKIVTFSTLYPDAVRNRHGIFVETRLRHLVGNGRVSSRVVAPVAWFPFKHRVFGDYATVAQVPSTEVRHDISIIHPRYPLIPKIGMTITPLLMALSVYRTMAKALREEPFDLIDAHYFYPDGVAAILLGKWLHKPVVITARGTDLNLIPNDYLPRKMILWAAARAQGMITVCQALKDVLLELGVADERVTVLRNGVDLQLFHPEAQRQALRNTLGMHGKVLMSVGHLIARKGHDLVIQALQLLPADVSLLIAGDGEEVENLKALTQSLQLQQRVTFLGALKQDALRQYYASVDALVLASSREGWANVLLEAMACGTPVVATDVWGTPEVVNAPEAGVLVQRTAPDIAQGVQALLANYPDRNATRRYAEQFSWEATTTGQEQLFTDILANGK